MEGGEGAGCLIEYFKDEINNEGHPTGRIEYNPVFAKTCQGGGAKLTDSKYLTPNLDNPGQCPVQLFKQFFEKRGNIITQRMFITPNPFWEKTNVWYKNMPVGKNKISKWLKDGAKMSGLDTKKRKITNHSLRATVVSHMTEAGVQEQEVIKITGHATASSLKPYLQINEEHHLDIINKVRKTNTQQQTSAETISKTTVIESHISEPEKNQLVFNNCVFNNCSFNK